MVTGVVHELDSGAHILVVYDGGRWHSLAAASSINGQIHYADGQIADLPVEIEGDLNRARDAAVRKAKVSQSYNTISYPASTIDVRV